MATDRGRVGAVWSELSTCLMLSDFQGIQMERVDDEVMGSSHCCMVAIGRLQITSVPSASELTNANNSNGQCEAPPRKRWALRGPEGCEGRSERSFMLTRRLGINYRVLFFLSSGSLMKSCQNLCKVLYAVCVSWNNTASYRNMIAF